MRCGSALIVVRGLGLVVALALPGRMIAQVDSSPRQPLTRYPVAVGDDITAAQKLFDELLSPFCPGLTLSNCPSPAADTLRRSVRARFEQGESVDSIKAALVAVYGEAILGAPPATGFNLVLWLLPWISVGVGGLGLAYVIGRRRRRKALTREPTAVAPSVSSDDERRLAEVLRELA